MADLHGRERRSEHEDAVALDVGPKPLAAAEQPRKFQLTDLEYLGPVDSEPADLRTLMKSTRLFFTRHSLWNNRSLHECYSLAAGIRAISERT